MAKVVDMTAAQHSSNTLLVVRALACRAEGNPGVFQDVAWDGLAKAPNVIEANAASYVHIEMISLRSGFSTFWSRRPSPDE